jgi:hypothetical protein
MSEALSLCLVSDSGKAQRDPRGSKEWSGCVLMAALEYVISALAGERLIFSCLLLVPHLILRELLFQAVGKFLIKFWNVTLFYMPR